jgi:hypothetical protein
VSGTAQLSTIDKLEVMAHKMSDEALRATIEEILAQPGYRLGTGQSFALLACMAEEARRVRA